MRTVELGRTGEQVSRLGLGCMGMSAFFGPTNREESLKALHMAVELGVTFFDTSVSYGTYDGENEDLLKEGLIDAGYRDKVFIGTKFGYSTVDGAGIDGSPENALKVCEGSLKRLGVEALDLFYLHGKDSDVPIEDTYGALADLVKDGKVRYLGISNHRADDIRKAHAVHPLSACQWEYSLWRRDIEAEVLPTCRELGISLVGYSPLGRGFLSDKLKRFEELTEDDWRRNSLQPLTFDDINDRIDQIQTTLKSLADEKDATSAQIALAWVLMQGDDIIPIPGTKRRSYLKENIDALQIELNKDDLARLEDMPAWLDYGKFG